MASKTIVIRKGATYKQVLRWETTPRTYANITAITKAGPAVLTIPTHGLPDGWRVDRIVAVGGMKEINTHQLSAGQFVRTGFGRQFPRGFKATVVDSNTIKLLDVNSSSFSTYTTGGQIEYYTPVNLAGYVARMQIRPSASSSTILASLTSAGGDITLDNTAKTITIQIAATATAAYTFRSGVASLELESSGGVVTLLIDSAPVTIRESDITR